MSKDNLTEELDYLRQLLHREQAFFDIELQQAKLFDKESFDSIKNVISLSRKVFSLHLAVLEQTKTDKIIEIPDLQALSKTIPQGFSTDMARKYQSYLADLLKPDNNKQFADKISQYIDSNPQDENYIVFSFLPAAFSCLWSYEEAMNFINFLLLVDSKHQPSITRLLLVHQMFFVFLSSIQADAAKVLAEQGNLQAILDLFKSRSFFFPAILRELISKTENPTQFFIDCILMHLLTKPSIHGLLPSNETRTFEYLIPSIEENKSNIEELVEFLKNTSNTILHLPHEQDLENILSHNNVVAYFFKSDIKVFTSIAGCDIPPPESEGVYQIPITRSISQNQTTTTENESVADPFESLIRSLIIQLDVSRIESDIIGTFEFAIALHAGSSRLQYELKLDAFKNLKQQYNAPDDVKYYLDLLKKAYDLRMTHRKDTLSTSASNDVFKVMQLHCSQAISFLLQTRQMAFFNLWDQATKPFKEAAANVAQLCLEPKKFSQTYISIVKSFSEFAESKKFAVQREIFLPIIYNKLTKIVTLSEFMKHHPDIVEKDAKVHKMIEEHLEELHASNNLNFLTIFKEDPSLMGLPASHLRRAFAEDSALPISEWIDRSLSAIINVLSYQGLKEIGADHWLPMTLILFMHVNPEKVCSVAAYMHHVLLSLPKDNSVIQSVEYNVTMTHSAASYFERELVKYDK
ncbi:hypothetical protein TVAG_214460 [Trichomonas vaginalis G3]|uniref:VPS9 domain-containing protein n=1 Tax=Trichomonas vaginalis (strain ATCC PRA-98 / G3) TaxID=412133 RepID=A2DK50_TRIV3|nr:hypothetical protein TVAGG3_0169860 [Trichomonas vaginalis G3]EAY19221.1 hypothetical protein TVAG_214460 [Trichomonas vaginalis G3]KAI5548499.1 hypothetical protein TVAGG3_0169860 [Trichomonas vaginalis G3]|eukprot:XP_001580207.1 hypothetical protein [Trichomonas vaginalis G3]